MTHEESWAKLQDMLTIERESITKICQLRERKGVLVKEVRKINREIGELHTKMGMPGTSTSAAWDNLWNLYESMRGPIRYESMSREEEEAILRGIK